MTISTFPGTHPPADDNVPAVPGSTEYPERDVEANPVVRVSAVSTVPGIVRLDVRGEIDLATAAEFHARLHEVLSHPSCATVIVDLRAVDFMGAHCVAVLADLSDRAAELGVQLAVVATRATMRRLLQVAEGGSGVYASVAAARAGIDLAAVETGRGDARG